MGLLMEFLLYMVALGLVIPKILKTFALEEKIHKIHKDKKEFRKLLKKYNENEVFKAIKAKDFEIVKKNYGTDSVVMNNNVYKDLYHMIFKDKNKYLEMQKGEQY